MYGAVQVCATRYLYRYSIYYRILGVLYNQYYNTVHGDGLVRYFKHTVRSLDYELYKYGSYQVLVPVLKNP
jgi:hypothetical protein